jgi:hypothetical protein
VSKSKLYLGYNETIVSPNPWMDEESLFLTRLKRFLPEFIPISIGNEITNQGYTGA